jgi:hypothetical protein
MNPLLNLLEERQWKDLVFRSVWRVTPLSKVRFVYLDSNEKQLIFNTEKDLDRFISKHHTDFEASKKRLTCKICSDFTFETKLHKNTMFMGNNEDFSTIDIYDKYSFSFVPSKNQFIPRTGEFQEFDLVCGLVEENKFKCWFICSQQFYRMWMVIFRPELDHTLVEETKRKRLEKEGLKAFIFKHNILMTNSSYRKEFLRAKEYELPTQDLGKKMHLIRFEPSFREYVHVYCALVMFLKYNADFMKENVPDCQTDLAKKYPLKKWDLPPNFKINLDLCLCDHKAQSKGLYLRSLTDDMPLIISHCKKHELLTIEKSTISFLSMDFVSLNSKAEKLYFSTIKIE